MLVLLSILVIIIRTMARHVRTSPQHGLHHICHARNHPSMTRSCRSRRESVGSSLQQLTQDDLCLPLQRKIKKFHPSSRQGPLGLGICTRDRHSFYTHYLGSPRVISFEAISRLEKGYKDETQGRGKYASSSAHLCFFSFNREEGAKGKS